MEKRKVIEMESYFNMLKPKKFCYVEVDEEAVYRFTKIRSTTITLRIIILMVYSYTFLDFKSSDIYTLGFYPFWAWFIVIAWIMINGLHHNIVVDKEGVKTYIKYGKWIKNYTWSELIEIHIYLGSASFTGSGSCFNMKVKTDGKPNQFGQVLEYDNKRIKINEYSSVCHLSHVVRHFANKNQIQFKTNCIKK